MKKTLLALSLLTALSGCQTTAQREAKLAADLCANNKALYDVTEPSGNEHYTEKSSVYDCEQGDIEKEVWLNTQTFDEETSVELQTDLAMISYMEARQEDACALPSSIHTVYHFKDENGYSIETRRHTSYNCVDGYYTDKFNDRIDEELRALELAECNDFRERLNSEPKDTLYGTRKAFNVNCSYGAIYLEFNLNNPRLDGFRSNTSMKNRAKAMLLDDNDVKEGCLKISDKNRKFLKENAGVNKYGNRILYRGDYFAENMVDILTCEKI